MIFSKTCQYAIWAMVELARHYQAGNGQKKIKAHEIAKQLDLPFPMVAKVLQMLAQAQLADSGRGPQGGFRLLRDPAEITLLDIMVAIDGPGLLEKCVLGLPMCNENNPCPAHFMWDQARQHVRSFLQSATLDKLVGAPKS
ncbi:MAG: Rrf2 family transcriptional regulator [Armatimonadetes bacterium]|nr:Rrf2 family transcriptional regulator [Armatimonadota bacterium]MDW8123091.1 Rrf2 family transcriptional regulator [Armatimonadota bacterium]